MAFIQPVPAAVSMDGRAVRMAEVTVCQIKNPGVSPPVAAVETC
jgi:hypothetical protein